MSTILFWVSMLGFATGWCIKLILGYKSLSQSFSDPYGKLTWFLSVVGISILTGLIVYYADVEAPVVKHPKQAKPLFIHNRTI